MRIQIPQEIGPEYIKQPDQPSNAMQLGLDIAGVGVAVANAVGEAKANQKLANHANDMNSLDELLTQSDRIDINDARIPDQIRENALKNLDPNDPDVAQVDGKTFIPTQRIMRDTVDFYRQKSVDDAESVNGNFREQYVAKINDSFDKLGHKVNTLEAGYIANDIQKTQLSAAQKYTQAGDYEGAVSSIATARNMGVLDDNAAMTAVQATRKSFADRLKYTNGEMSNKLGLSAAQGNRPAMDDFSAQMNTQLDDAVAKGIITPEERNAYASQNKLDGEFQFAKGQLLRTYASGGIDEANKQLLGFSAQVPEGVDPDKWDSKISAMRADLNQTKQLTEGAAADSKKILETRKKVVAGQTYVGTNSMVVTHDQKENLNAYYNDKLQQYDLNNPDSRKQWMYDTLDIVRSTKNIPQGASDSIVSLAMAAQSAAGTDDPAAQGIAEDLGRVVLAINAMPTMGSNPDANELMKNPYLNAVAYLVKSGVPTEKINTTATGYVNVSYDEKKKREENIEVSKGKKEDYRKQSLKSMGSDIGAFVGNKDNAVNQNTMAKIDDQYDKLYDFFYVTTGNSDLAAKSAGNIISKQWTVADHGGQKMLEKNSLMASVPEINGSKQWARDQSVEAINMVAPDLTSVYGENNVSLFSDNETEQGKGYVLKYRQGEGKPWVKYTTPDATFVRINLDPTQSKEWIQQHEDAQKITEQKTQSTQYKQESYKALSEVWKAPLESYVANTGDPYTAQSIYAAKITDMIDAAADEQIKAAGGGNTGRGVQSDPEKVKAIKESASQAKKDAMKYIYQKTDEQLKAAKKPDPVQTGRGIKGDIPL